MKQYIILVIVTFINNSVFAETNIDWWLIKDGKSCALAKNLGTSEHNLSPKSILSQVPSCITSKVSGAFGLMKLDCSKTALKTRFAYAKTEKGCKDFIKLTLSIGSKKYQKSWIIKNGKECLDASEGELNPTMVSLRNPGCKEDTTGLPEDVFFLDCRNTPLATMLAYATSRKACERMVARVKSKGF